MTFIISEGLPRTLVRRLSGPLNERIASSLHERIANGESPQRQRLKVLLPKAHQRQPEGTNIESRGDVASVKEVCCWRVMGVAHG